MQGAELRTRTAAVQSRKADLLRRKLGRKGAHSNLNVFISAASKRGRQPTADDGETQ